MGDKKKRRDTNKACNSDTDDDDWTQVNNKAKNKANEHVCRALEKPGGKKDGRKTNRKPEALRENGTQEFNQTSNRKPTFANLKPQAAALRHGKKAHQKKLCRYNVCIEQDRDFNVVCKLLGDKGCHMKTIAENTGAKLRIRGRGSGYREGPDQIEASNDPLMICISADSLEGFSMA